MNKILWYVLSFFGLVKIPKDYSQHITDYKCFNYYPYQSIMKGIPLIEKYKDPYIPRTGSKRDFKVTNCRFYNSKIPFIINGYDNYTGYSGSV